ncbi:MAG: YIP1 family protein [Gemmatimonadales bacterium]
MTEPVTEPSPPNASLWEDFIDIFTSPSAVFRRRVNSGFGVQLLVLTVLFAIIVIGTKSLVMPAIDADIARQGAKMMQSHPEITAEQLQKQQSMGETFGPIFVVILIPIMAMLTGFVLWLVGKIFDSKQTPSTAMMVATYAFFPKLLAALAGALIAFLSSPERLNSMSRLTVGLGALLDPDKASPVLLALLTRVDVFTIWVTVLLAIGLHVTGKVPKAQAYAAAAIVWLIGALPGVLPALRG